MLCIVTAALIAAVQAADAQLIWQQADVATKFVGTEQSFLAYDAYHSGRIHDLLILSGTGGCLVGGQTGGVWLVSSNGSAIPLSNTWDLPDIDTLAFGFGDEKHVYAGGSGLYVSDYTSLFSYFNWFPIHVPGDGHVYAVTTVRFDTGAGVKSYIVIGTSAGIYTAELPPSPAGPYTWIPASGGGQLPWGPYSGLAAGPDGSGVIVAGFFKGISAWAGQTTPALWRGTMDTSGVLNLAPANIVGPSVTAQQPAMIGYVSVDSCAGLASRMYASVYNTSDQLFDILRSNDAGATWSAVPRTLDPGDPNNTIKTWDGSLDGKPFLGDSGSGGWIKHISVSPTDPDAVTVPGLRSIRTYDGGTTWHGVGGSWSSPGSWTGNTLSYHDDWHVIRFDPANKYLTYAGTDGGLQNTLGVPPLPWPATVMGPDYFYSNLNSRLHTLQFESDPDRGLDGESDADSVVAQGLTAGGTQDNGDIFALMNPLATGPWQQLQGCDGGQTQLFDFSPTAAWVMHSPICLGYWYPLVADAVLNFSPFVTNVEIIPPLKKDPKGNKRPDGLLCLARSVYRPAYKKGGRLMYVVGGGQASVGNAQHVVLDKFPNSVFGLFAGAKQFGTDMEWEYLGDIPAQVTGTASYDGSLIICGGSDGNIYGMDPTNGKVQAMPINAPFQGGVAHRIIYHLPAPPICAFSGTDQNGVVRGAVLQFNGLTWNPIFTVVNQQVQDIQVDENASPPIIYAVTDNRVHSSADGGKTWNANSLGLPERFHGSQLKIVRYSNGQNWIYLTTYGRSVWAANLAGH